MARSVARNPHREFRDLDAGLSAMSIVGYIVLVIGLAIVGAALGLWAANVWEHWNDRNDT
jgi:hypothetical protein